MQIVSLARETWANFQRHKGPWLAAAIAYFTMLAVAPLIIVIVEVAGFFLGHHQAALDQLYAYLGRSAGPSAASGIRSIVASTFGRHEAGALAQIASWTVFAIAAIGLFASLQNAMNTVWDVEPPRRPILEAIRARVAASSVVIVVALLLFALLAIDAALSTSSLVPAAGRAVQLALSFAITAVAFATAFAVLPETRVAWRSVWLGAAITAALFVAGQFALGWYLGRAALSSSYGAFGGLVAFLIWADYSAQIFLLGAEFAHVLAERETLSGPPRIRTSNPEGPSAGRGPSGSRL